MNQALFTPLSLSQLFKEKGIKQIEEAGSRYWIKISSGWKLFLLEEGEDGPSQTPFPWCKAFQIGELPDVFRQVFGGKDFVSTKAQGEWEMFCMMYFNNPKNAWETLEKTIRSL